ncbi:MAG: hypothetical protein UU79_C0014G0025 [candidate division WWE3 bacterium GW2011_GWE1_41_72]|uniref:Uncharacterized protein n=1 Tax=candidate division WWE3 bacterium GW2011_GWF1_42_14 TaxID=1619138 RepID=A0A0G1ARN4_UNCKA|nr:MAG: hypothetical protein UU79_C0014G0025 [candidate division WWE3 bacterium GW2011_GWE1_41_72]KKS36741.1 MAG: hypothetical protein UV00_C0022G0002 [candidate division WWE3 bacterium GW2011_GWF1_42_14]
MYLLYYQYSDSVINIPDMKRIRETPQDSNNLPQNGSQLPVEERLKILANLIVEKILTQQPEDLIKESDNHHGQPA